MKYTNDELKQMARKVISSENAQYDMLSETLYMMVARRIKMDLISVKKLIHAIAAGRTVQ